MGLGSLPHEAKELFPGPGLERVVLPFLLADGRGRRGSVIMTGEDHQGVVQRHDAVEQTVGTSLRGSRPEGPSVRIRPRTGYRPSRNVTVEEIEDRVRRVAGRVDDLKVEPARARERRAVVDAHVLAQRRGAVRDHLGPGTAANLLVGGDVVWVAVGVQNVSNLDSVRVDRFQDRIDPGPWVDHDPVAAHAVGDDVGEVEQGADAELLELHDRL